ncbi:MAG TPA: hypothetical protein VGF95_10965 [Solirubrobacteraceae bacterium]|jgi:hypothetical protein
MQGDHIQEQDERQGAIESAIHGMLVDRDEQRPWSVREIELEIGDARLVSDALGNLYGCGLVHRCGEFVWATRAALAADALTI